MESVLEALPADLREFVLRRAQAPDAAGLDAALAKDRATAGAGMLGQNLSRAASLYRGEKAGPVAPPVPDEVRAFLLKQQMGKGDDPLARLDTAAGIVKNLRPPEKAADPGNEPAPPEWNALPGMTKAQAIAAGYAKRTEGPEVLEPELEARAKRAGVPTAGRKREPVIADILAAERARQAAGNRSAAADARESASDAKKAGQLYAGTFFKFRPDVPAGAIPDGTRSELIDQTGLVADVADASDQLVGLYRQHGSQITGPAAAKMRTLVTDIRLVAKSPAVYNLGVLSGPDLDILRSVVDDPTQLEGIFKNQAKFREFVTEIETFRSRTVARLTKRWESFGADPVGGPFVKGGAPDLISEAAALEGGKGKRITRTVNGETRVWNGSAWVKE